jgi:hypothetical protein
VRYAAADDLQKAFSNVLFDFHEDPLTVVGADGFRLVIYTISVDNLTLLASQDHADLQIRGPSE